jgi:glycosyltransferase involved in cell wall biosynthesis
MQFHYISASTLPSRAANAVHVVQQCHALARAGADLTLYARRSVEQADRLPELLSAAYGVDSSAWRLITYHGRLHRAAAARTAALALARLPGQSTPIAILSRNLYAAFVGGVLQRRRLIYEAHDLEYGARKALQRAIITRPWVVTVGISEALVRHLVAHHGVRPTRSIVLHDAAPGGMQPLPREHRRRQITAFVPEAAGSWDAVAAYFGHLYPGRGIEIIEAMARARPRVLFAVFGGNDTEIHSRRASTLLPNLTFAGHVPHAAARQAMLGADVLLMPYQRSVSVGTANRDTAAWMSPMKMFEYLASGVPIISSDLPVLREVLAHERNALLVVSDDTTAWTNARVGDNAHEDYVAHHTWDRRATELLKLADSQ